MRYEAMEETVHSHQFHDDTSYGIFDTIERARAELEEIAGHKLNWLLGGTVAQKSPGLYYYIHDVEEK
jgi:hypothetical protein